MSDWERIFGSDGMNDGGMRVINRIVAGERSPLRSERSRSSERRQMLYEKEFETWAEASQWAKENTGWKIVRNENGSGFICGFEGYSEKERELRGIDDARKALNLIASWPSGSEPWRLDYANDYSKYGMSYASYRKHVFFYEVSLTVIRISSSFKEDKHVGGILLETYLKCSLSFRDQIDQLLDNVGALPAVYVRPIGPVPLPALDGSTCFDLIASWPGSCAWSWESEWDDLLYRDHRFSYDIQSATIYIRTQDNQNVGVINLETFKHCHLHQLPFRAHVDEVLDKAGAAPASDNSSPAADWRSHPIRDAIMSIVGDESAWAVAPPKSLYGGHEVRFSMKELCVMEPDFDGPLISFSIDEIKKCGTMVFLLDRVKSRICSYQEGQAKKAKRWGRVTPESVQDALFEREKKFTWTT